MHTPLPTMGDGWVSLLQHEIKVTTTGHKSIGIHPGLLPGSLLTNKPFFFPFSSSHSQKHSDFSFST
jgi:hypothetical protein